MHETGRTHAEPTHAASADERRALLGARVSTIIDAHPEALDTLISHGFTLLSQAPLRWAMAHTVNLAQACRLRGLGADEQEQLLAALVALGVATQLDDAEPDDGVSAERQPPAVAQQARGRD